MRTLSLTATLVLALAVTACGGGETVDATGDSGGGGGNLSIAATDFAFDPAAATAPAGTVAVTVENTGQAPHTFTVADADIDEQIAPGDSVTVDVTVPAGGTVAYVCTLHEAQGMTGEISAE